MANRNSSLFNDLVTEVKESSQSKQKRTSKTSYLEDRKNNISDLVGGQIEEKTLRWIDPKSCKMWSCHNRRYDLLNEVRCKDLIEGIKSQGRQEFPAIVRKTDDPDYEYEVICGARRHWTISYLREHNYPQFKFLIELRELTDEEAFRLSDVENRDKEDISDYERALDYKSALTRYYRSQKEMATRLEVSETWLSRFLDLAEMPSQIVELFPDVTFLKVQHSVDLKKHLKDPQQRQQLIGKARQLKEAQNDRIIKNENHLSEEDLFYQLKRFNQTEQMPKPLKKAYSLPGSKKTLFTIEKSIKGPLSIKLKSFDASSKAKIKEMLLEALDDFC